MPTPEWSLALIGNASGQTFGAEGGISIRGVRLKALGSSQTIQSAAKRYGVELEESD